MIGDYVALAIALKFTLGALVLLAVLWFVVRSIVIEHFRQNVFELRRELFILASDEVLRFDSPTYQRLRNTMNGLLRFAERMTVTRMVLVHRLMPPHRAAPMPLDLGDPRVLRIAMRMNATVVSYHAGVAMTSPMFWLCLPLTITVAILSAVVTPIRNWIRAYLERSAKRFEAEAEESERRYRAHHGGPAAC